MTRTSSSQIPTSKTAASYCRVMRSGAFKRKCARRFGARATAAVEVVASVSPQIHSAKAVSPPPLLQRPPAVITTTSPPLAPHGDACLPVPYVPRVAMDCEMVGVGPCDRSALARCSIVDERGEVVYDRYIKPPTWVKNYRTRWSGITRRHLRGAEPFAEAVRCIESILRGCVVVGHDLRNDFTCLKFGHPRALIRDTSEYQPFKHSLQLPNNHKPSLKRLAKAFLDKEIQTSSRGHCSVEDARAAMELYKRSQTQWEERLINDRVFLGDTFWQNC